MVWKILKRRISVILKDDLVRGEEVEGVVCEVWKGIYNYACGVKKNEWQPWREEYQIWNLKPCEKSID